MYRTANSSPSIRTRMVSPSVTRTSSASTVSPVGAVPRSGVSVAGAVVPSVTGGANVTDSSAEVDLSSPIRNTRSFEPVRRSTGIVQAPVASASTSSSGAKLMSRTMRAPRGAVPMTRMSAVVSSDPSAGSRIRRAPGAADAAGASSEGCAPPHATTTSAMPQAIARNQRIPFERTVERVATARDTSGARRYRRSLRQNDEP
jgi:hypothetical protein